MVTSKVPPIKSLFKEDDKPVSTPMLVRNLNYRCDGLPAHTMNEMLALSGAHNGYERKPPVYRPR